MHHAIYKTCQSRLQCRQPYPQGLLGFQYGWGCRLAKVLWSPVSCLHHSWRFWAILNALCVKLFVTTFWNYLSYSYFWLLVSCLSNIASKNQLKWLGTKDELLCFLSSQLIDNLCDFQMHDNGHACYASKAEQITCNFYTKAKTLQIQGEENAEQLKLNLISLAKFLRWTRNKMAAKFPTLTVPLQATTYHLYHQNQSLQSLTCLIIHQLNALEPVISMLK